MYRNIPIVLKAIVIVFVVCIFPKISYSQSSSGVCSGNNYALCSHAKCQCLDENGKKGDCVPYKFTGDIAQGWAKCDCPVVKADILQSNSLYAANFGTLSCEERKNPTPIERSELGSFPPYVNKTTADVYSEYSFGDSLPNDDFGTLDNASLMVCRQPILMTLCLDMPCEIGEDGRADCYCQNVTTQDYAIKHKWNTLGGGCGNPKSCFTQEGEIWSAALVKQTTAGIEAIANYQIENIGTTDLPNYCPIE